MEIFLETIILNNPLRKANYYAINVEFQVRENPHVHSFIWVLNSPKLTKSNLDECIGWVDNVMRSDRPDPYSEPDLSELVKTYQIQRHSKTCHKYRNENCRCPFGSFSTNRTIIAQPLSDSLPVVDKNEIMENRNFLLTKA